MNWTEVFAPADSSIIDFETSGLNETLDYIIEAGLLEVRNNLPGEPISWVVNPNFPDAFHVTTEVTILTGITDTQITYGADPRELFPSFINRIRWVPIWGHNIIRFDCKFIDGECRRMCTIPPPKSAWFDTAATFKAWRLSLPDQKWTQEPDILDELEDYPNFYEWGMYVLSKPIKGLFYNLPFACETLQIDTSDLKWHRAGADCVGTYRLREALKKVILQ